MGASINDENKVEDEINKRIMDGNWIYFFYKQLFKPNILSKRAKIKLCKSLVRPAITYSAETLSVKIKDEYSVRVFESKIIRRIYGLMCIEGNWRIRTNKEIDELIRHEDIVSYGKSLRIRQEPG
jgi:hypothetical protein